MKSIGDVIDEAIKAGISQVKLDEKEKQDQTSGDVSQFSGEPSEQEQETETSSKTVDDDKEAMEGVPELDGVIEKLNTIRSGKSLKDEDVSRRFEEYFESLSVAEKTALFAFLKGIGEIVVGDLPGQEATEPSDKEPDVKMHKGKKVQRKSVQPTVVKKPSPPEEGRETPEGGEDTSPPVPISPKKK